MKTVPAAEANRHFSRLMREAAAGEPVLVTDHGRPAVKIVAATDEDVQTADRKAAMDRLIEQLNSQPRWSAPKWTREELYEDEPYPETFK